MNDKPIIRFKYVWENISDPAVYDTITGYFYFINDEDDIERIVGLLNNLHQKNQQLKHYNLYEDNKRLQTIIADLKKENEKLRQMIKENVFQRYNEGSLADLEFKAIAYDDIINVKLSDESEPKVIVYCNYGKRKNIMSFCQMFIPFGIAYEIKEVIDDE